MIWTSLKGKQFFILIWRSSVDIFATIYWLSLVCYGEARGEPVLGQKAVIHTVLNRADISGKDVEHVVKNPKQYSSFNHGVPSVLDHKAFIRCMDMANIVISQNAKGDTYNGITHFHRKDITPYWAKDKEMDKIIIIGDHIYYRNNSIYNDY